jgi:hypothetical protein
MKFLNLNRVTFLITLLGVNAFCLNVHAQWGSLHGNNRSAPAPSFAPRPAAPAFRAPAPSRPETRPITAPHPENIQRAPVQIDRARANETDRRRMDIDEDRRQSYFWSDYHRGMRVEHLPDGYRRFRFHDHDYFYFEGVFYDDGSSGYVVIDPPVDASIPELPPGAETVTVGDTLYYYAAGAFYVQQPDGTFEVVAAPMGVTVSLLPPEATAVVADGTTFYQAEGTYYLPVMQNGVTAYVTVPPPQ